ncbi:MAG: hypothetical protein K0B08_08755 [Bacteroidales bacterium]|nr:hypothetical protein [Bacteroidales bacterium]
MEDYIYFILLIAWVLFAFYRRSQKKAAAARQASSQPGTETGKRPFSLEDLFGDEDEPHEIYEEDEWQQPAPTVYQPTEIPEIMRTGHPNDYQQRGYSASGQMEERQHGEFIKDIEYQEDMSDNRQSEFDPSDIRENIRQAVIYAEILNRPYD